MSVPTRVIDNENNRTLHPGDEIEGQLAGEQVALGNAEPLPDLEEAPATAAPLEEPEAEPEAPAE